MKIAIRLDDVTSTMDMGKLAAFEALLDRYGVTPLIGVVPDNRDPKLMAFPAAAGFYGEVRRLMEKGWSVAMHGTYHVYTTNKSGLFPLNLQSEFAGLPYEEQVKLLTKGKEILAAEGIETDIFMAPSHTYDWNTIRALREVGITKITDGYGPAPYVRKGITFYPISFRRSDSLKPGRKGYTTFVYHPADLDEKGMQGLEELLKTGNVISYSEYLAVPAKSRSLPANRREYAMALAKRLMLRHR